MEWGTVTTFRVSDLKYYCHAHVSKDQKRVRVITIIIRYKKKKKRIIIARNT